MWFPSNLVTGYENTSPTKPDYLINAVDAGALPNADEHPPFRELTERRRDSYFAMVRWIVRNLLHAGDIVTFVAIPVHSELGRCLASISCCEE
jgi:hypothetical protein